MLKDICALFVGIQYEYYTSENNTLVFDFRNIENFDKAYQHREKIHSIANGNYKWYKTSNSRSLVVKLPKKDAK